MRGRWGHVANGQDLVGVCSCHVPRGQIVGAYHMGGVSGPISHYGEVCSELFLVFNTGRGCDEGLVV